MDSPRVEEEALWARAVSRVSISNETITPHAWKNHLELSPPLTTGTHPTHAAEVGEMLAGLSSLPQSRA